MGDFLFEIVRQDPACTWMWPRICNVGLTHQTSSQIRSGSRPYYLIESWVPQDCFRLGLVPADTDFSVFAHPEHGAWPGLDIAFMLDAGAYHTDRDTVDRIKPGTLQVPTLYRTGPFCIAASRLSPFYSNYPPNRQSR